ncbi:MAG: GNAT family N-acetyltransferase [Chitinispirillales bacterium]|jgi:GNAT superfamily N-acetyltransferase|nr:GNAT family N-acetyltransferase [Chitinispirillales bacterium]
MEKINIRRAVISDLPYLYEICLKTGDAGKDASDMFFDPYMMGQYYAAPYLVYPEGICFVAEHTHRPQGYILAVPDTINFRRWMEEQWLPPIRKRYAQPLPPELLRSEKEKRYIDIFHKSLLPIDLTAQPWLTDYPAHLHIDFLPSIQRKGIGRILIDTIFNELIQKKTPGIHLDVGSSNPGAIAFYNKTGFSTIKEHEWGLTMGKKLLH